jgi:hypothetical protein
MAAVTVYAVGKATVAEIHLLPIAGVVAVGTLTGEMVGRGAAAVTTNAVGKAAVTEGDLLPI